MDNNKQYYVTYKFYDEKERRLAIFAVPSLMAGEYEDVDTPKEWNALLLFVIPCSKKDTFSKAKAKELFEENWSLKTQGFEGIKGVTELLIPIENNKPKFTFIKWCEDNYYKYIPTVMAIEAPMLYRGDELLNGKFPYFDIVPIEEENFIPQDSSIN